MTYRNKLLLKRFLIVLGIVIAAVLLFLLIGYSYLGRYVVYTEDGAVFSFNMEEAEPEESRQMFFSGDVELITGSPISAADISIGVPAIDDVDVNGIFLDYDMLQDSSALEQLDLSGINTLILEIRSSGNPILDTTAIQTLISRAKSDELYLIAQISCLSDNDYVLSHSNLALKNTDGTLWTNEDGDYWLDPTQDAVLSYLEETMEALAAMGFDEVLLDDFSLPTDLTAAYGTEEESPDDILSDAYRSLQDTVSSFCKLGLLISDPAIGHQAMDAAERIYVLYSDGSSAAEYALAHADHYLVFLTDSHDTRFDEYGKITFSSSSEEDTENSESSDWNETGEDAENAGGEYEESDDWNDEADWDEEMQDGWYEESGDGWYEEAGDDWYEES